MSDTPAATYRSQIDPPADRVQVREAEELGDDDGLMEIRLPVASTGEVRNEGDDPLTTGELRGMAQQVGDLTRGVFPEHGMGNFVSAGQYSQFEKLGYWADGEVAEGRSEDNEDMLIATARMPDPETLPSAVGSYREALAILKEQAKRGIPISSSIGWRADEDAPGGNDLMEVSIVGIGADPRTTTEGGTDALARAAVEAGADPEALVREVAEQVGVDAERPLGPSEDPDRFEDFDECVDALVENSDLSREDAEEICGSWEQTSDADAPEDTHDMSEPEDTPDEDGGTTDAEQDAPDDGDEQTRMPEDVTPSDLATLVAASYDGVEPDALVDAWDDMGDFTGGVDVDALAGLVATATGSDTETVESAMEDLMGEEQEGDKPDDYDEDEEDEEESSGEPDETQDADDDTSDLEERIASLEDELESVRSGETDVETPETEDETDAEERDADDGETTDDAATAGPNWRA